MCRPTPIVQTALWSTGRAILCNTANFGIDPIPSKYRARIADTDTDTCDLKKNIHLNDQQQLKKLTILMLI